MANRRSAILRVLCPGAALGLMAMPATAQLDDPLFFREGRIQFEQQVRDLQSLSPGPVLTVSTGEQVWQALVSEAGKFTLWLPVGPIVDEAQTLTLDGIAHTFGLLTSTTATARYLVAYAEGDPAQLPTLATALTDQIGQPPTQQRPLERAYPALELTFAQPEGLLVVQVAAANGRLYMVEVDQAEAPELTPASVAFLAAFQPLP